jgi:hypothetical protein
MSFADRIFERYPEGLTGIFAVGGTRTTYILSENRQQADPGKIEDFAAHGAYLQNKYAEFMRMFFELGGRNMIITASSFRGFHERGGEYAELVAQELLRLMNSDFQTFYRENDIDPYFVGIDTLLHLPQDTAAHHMAQELVDFQKGWAYAEGHRKLIWEVASIPLYSFWQFFQQMTPDEREVIDAEIAKQDRMEDIYHLLYRRFARAMYGTDIPLPHLYVGTNKSGDLKWRSPLPIALSGGEYMRLFYTPYPTLFMTRETMQAILEDLAFKERFHSLNTDYKQKYTSEKAQTEYERVMELRAQPETTLGFSRRVVDGD